MGDVVIDIDALFRAKNYDKELAEFKRRKELEAAKELAQKELEAAKELAQKELEAAKELAQKELEAAKELAQKELDAARKRTAIEKALNELDSHEGSYKCSFKIGRKESNNSISPLASGDVYNYRR